MQKTIIILIFITLGFSLQAQNVNHSLWTSILKKYVSENGQVDYQNLKKDRKLLTKYMSHLD
ncbi:MAG: DUF547 domain-containing protein, partial [Flavobacteriales bacterium]